MNLAFTAVRITQTLADQSIAFLADDEQQAEALAEAVKALSPMAKAVHVPSSDALPGEAAPASPANAGRRASALRMLRLAQGEHVACILSGEGDIEVAMWERIQSFADKETADPGSQG